MADAIIGMEREKVKDLLDLMKIYQANKSKERLKTTVL